MKKNLFIFLFGAGLLLNFKSNAQHSQQLKNHGHLYGVFDGRTPCGGLADQLDIQILAECIKLKWRLALFTDSITGKPEDFQLWLTNYRDDPLKGKWSIEKGTAQDPNATVFRFVVDEHRPLYLQKGDNNILFFLSPDKKLMIGNRDFSYTLNRNTKFE